jgi:hypothetical protein
MGRWLLAAALALPLAARADPPQPPPGPTIVTTQPAIDEAHAPAYAPQPPLDPTVSYTGWGLRASIQGRSLDLDSLSGGWSADSSAGPRDIEAGYGWRKGAADAMFGYGQYGPGAPGDGGPHFEAERGHDGAGGVIGFSLVLHAR